MFVCFVVMPIPALFHHLMLFMKTSAITIVTCGDDLYRYATYTHKYILMQNEGLFVLSEVERKRLARYFDVTPSYIVEYKADFICSICNRQCFCILIRHSWILDVQ